MRCLPRAAAATATATVALGALILPLAAQAVVVLGFERINAAYPSTSFAAVAGFYGGGTSSQGTSGANFGIGFGPGAVAVCLNPIGGACSNASAGGLSVNSSQGALGIGSGNSTWFDIPAGFSNAIGFRYAVAVGSVATIAAYGGPGGSGAQLAPPLALFNPAPGCAAYNAPLCGMGPGGYSFAGVAKSVVFTGLPGKVVWDDLTLGFNDPQWPPPVPEPAAWALWALGLAGLAGWRFRVRRRAPPRRPPAGSPRPAP
jgi:MYXO-CTERM domain-containing protein